MSEHMRMLPNTSPAQNGAIPNIESRDTINGYPCAIFNACLSTGNEPRVNAVTTDIDSLSDRFDSVFGILVATLSFTHFIHSKEECKWWAYGQQSSDIASAAEKKESGRESQARILKSNVMKHMN